MSHDGFIDKAYKGDVKEHLDVLQGLCVMIEKQ